MNHFETRPEEVIKNIQKFHEKENRKLDQVRLLVKRTKDHSPTAKHIAFMLNSNLELRVTLIRVVNELFKEFDYLKKSMLKQIENSDGEVAFFLLVD